MSGYSTTKSLGIDSQWQGFLRIRHAEIQIGVLMGCQQYGPHHIWHIQALDGGPYFGPKIRAKAIVARAVQCYRGPPQKGPSKQV